MAKISQIWQYLSNLEWTERVQHDCKFCDRSNFEKIVYEDEDVYAIENRRLGGAFHWLIIPSRHIRDVENLGLDDLATLKKMADVKATLLETNRHSLPLTSNIIAGYHRGRRPLVGGYYYPDIISIHHLHLHVIVNPRMDMELFKYPAWLPLMWKSDAEVLRELEQLAAKSSSSLAAS